MGPAAGEQACGDVGPGRMEEPALIANARRGPVRGRRCWREAGTVITAGPTREALDPVRYISNHSSGKMGFALAEAAADWPAPHHPGQRPCQTWRADRA